MYELYAQISEVFDFEEMWMSKFLDVSEEAANASLRYLSPWGAAAVHAWLTVRRAVVSGDDTPQFPGFRETLLTCARSLVVMLASSRARMLMLDCPRKLIARFTCPRQKFRMEIVERLQRVWLLRPRPAVVDDDSACIAWLTECLDQVDAERRERIARNVAEWHSPQALLLRRRLRRFNTEDRFSEREGYYFAY